MKLHSSEIDYQVLFENLFDGLAYCQIIFDGEKNPIDFVFIEINKNCEPVTGLQITVGKKITELLPGIKESSPELFTVFTRVALTGISEKLEIYIKPLRRWFLISVYSSKKGYFTAIFKNITDQKQTEKFLENARVAARNVLDDLETEKEKLAEEKAKGEAMLLSIGDGVLIVDPVGKIKFINQSAQNMLGWTSGEVIDKLLSDTIPLEDAKGKLVPGNMRPVQIALAIGSARAGLSESKTANRVYYYVRKDKTKFPADMTFSRVMLANRIVGAIGVFRDISKETNLDQAKTEFVSLASHQLRTPLTTVNWYSEILLKNETNIEKQKEYLRKIHTGSGRMVTLINALLNVSRIELGTLIIKLQPVHIVELLEDVINEQQPQIDEKKMTIVDTFSMNISIVLESDPDLLRMVFQNLLSNAIKYTLVGGRIGVSSLVENNSLIIIFSDTGFGIPKKDYNNIFTKMFRADNVKEKGLEGTGLGLYIVKSVLDAIGGTIRFESEEGKGSKFFVTIPYKKEKNINSNL